MIPKELISFPFAGGIDTKTDPKNVPESRLLSLQNAVFDRPGSLRTRQGYKTFADLEETGKALMRFKDELLVFGPDQAYSVGPNGDLVPKGIFYPVLQDTAPISTSSTSQAQVAGAVHPDTNVAVWAWVEDGDLYYQVQDLGTGQTLRNRTLLQLDSDTPRLVASKQAIVLYFRNSATNRLQRVLFNQNSPVTPTTPANVTENTTTVDGLLISNPSYDVKVLNSQNGPQIYMAFNNRDTPNTSLTLRTYSWFDPTILIDQVESTDIGVTIESESFGPVCVSQVRDPDQSEPVGLIGVTYMDGNDDIRFIYYRTKLVAGSGSTYQGTVLVGPVIPTDIMSITAVPIPYQAPDDWRIKVFWSSTFSPVSRNFTEFAEIGSNLLTPENAGTFYTAYVVGHAFRVSGQPYMVVGHTSDFQEQFILVDQNFIPVGRAYVGTAFTDSTGVNQTIGTVSIVGNKVHFACARASVATTQDGVFQSNPVASRITWDFNGFPHTYGRVETENSLLISGALLTQYDGLNLVENNFILFPSDTTFVESDPGANHSYQYALTYEWTDGQGVRHFSSPSVPSVVTTLDPITTTTDYVDITYPNLFLTRKTGVQVGIYRTLDGGQTFYRIALVDNDTTSATGTYRDDNRDDDIDGNPLLYTNGGILENDPLPSTKAICTHQGRVWAVSSDETLKVFFSKPLQPGQPAEFSQTLFLQIDPDGGGVDSIYSLDETLICFKRDRIFAIFGQGPDATGGGGQFSQPQLITTDAGCPNPRSIVRMQMGLIFESLTGLQVLTRGRSSAFIGAPVEQFTQNGTTTSSVLYQDRQAALWTLDSGTSLYYDTLLDQWSTFSNIQATDSVIWRDQHTFIRKSGRILKQNPGSYRDDSTFVKFKLSTTWYKFDGLNGYSLVPEFMVLGQYNGPIRMRVRVYCDYSPIPSQSQDITLSVPAYGSESPYGSGSPYGGQFYPFQYRIFMKEARATAFRVEIESLPVSGSTPTQFELSGISMLVGRRRRQNTVPVSRTFTGNRSGP